MKRSGIWGLRGTVV